MATRLYMHFAAGSNIPAGIDDREMNTSKDSGLNSGNRASVAGPTSGIYVQLSGAKTYYNYQIDRELTVSGTVTFNVWASENNSSANGTVQCTVERYNAAGTFVSTVADSEFGPELGTSRAAKNWSASPTSTTFAAGDWLTVSWAFNDATALTMATGFTFSYAYGGTTDNADGDTWVEFTEDITQSPIALKTAGTWARMVTDGGTVAIPGSPAAGDRMFLFGSWKTYTVTADPGVDWTLIDDFSDGTTAAGNGTGSVHNAVWYRDWQSGDAAPVIDYSAAPSEGHWVIMLWRIIGETWGAPTAAHVGYGGASASFSFGLTSLSIEDDSAVMALVGFRDDTSVMTRSATSITHSAGSVTWDGDYIESPATHFSSTTGLDVCGDLGHRYVVTGGSGITIDVTGTISAAETGTATLVMQGYGAAAADSNPAHRPTMNQLLSH